MISKVCLWVRRHLKKIIWEVNLALAIAGILGTVYELVTECKLSTFWLISLIVGTVGLVTGRYWHWVAPQIPVERVKQDANPSKYVLPTIVSLDNSNLVMYSRVRNIMPVDSVYLTIDIRSQLKFDVTLISLGGDAVINGIETSPPQAVLENKSDIKLIRGETLPNLKWRLNIKDPSCESALMNELRSLVKDVPNTIKLRLRGWDKKGRPYQLETEQFIIGE